MSELGAEWMRFLTERNQEDVKFQHAVLHAKTPADLQRIQAGFMQKALEQYSAETGRMVDLAQKLFTPDDEDEGGKA